MKKYHSEALMVIHQDAEGLHRLGIINDDEMREYDKNCLVRESKPIQKKIKSTIKMEQASTATN